MKTAARNVYHGSSIPATAWLFPQSTRRAISVAVTQTGVRFPTGTCLTVRTMRFRMEPPLLYRATTGIPCRAFVWHSGFLDNQTAADIRKKIHLLQMEDTLRRTHSEFRPSHSTTLRDRQEEIAALQDDYYRVTGEAWDDDSDPTIENAAFPEDYEDKEFSILDSDDTRGHTTLTTGHLSDVEVVELKIRLLEEDIQHLVELGADEANVNMDGSSRIQELREMLEELQDEYETMVEAEHKQTTKTMNIELD